MKVVSKMNKENDEKLVKAFPLLYGDRYGSEQSTLMCWGFPGDGWFDIIWDLSSKLEPIIRKFIADNPNLECSTCGCERTKHYASATDSPGKCLSIHKKKLLLTTGLVFVTLMQVCIQRHFRLKKNLVGSGFI